MCMTTAEFNSYLKNKNRKDVVYIFRAGKPVKLRGVKPSDEFAGDGISARFYPGRKTAVPANK